MRIRIMALVTALLAMLFVAQPSRADVGGWTKEDLENSVYYILTPSGEASCFAIGKKGNSVYFATAAHCVFNEQGEYEKEFYVCSCRRLNQHLKENKHKNIYSCGYKGICKEIGEGFNYTGYVDRSAAVTGEDVAIVKVDNMEPEEVAKIKLFQLADSKRLDDHGLGMEVTAIGFPGGMGKAASETKSSEALTLVSVPTDITSIQESDGGQCQYIVVNRGSINQGHSGGPVIYSDSQNPEAGKVVGIVSQFNRNKQDAFLTHVYALQKLVKKLNLQNSGSEDEEVSSQDSEAQSEDAASSSSDESTVASQDGETDSSDNSGDNTASNNSENQPADSGNMVMMGVCVFLGVILLIIVLMAMGRNRGGSSNNY